MYMLDGPLGGVVPVACEIAVMPILFVLSRGAFHRAALMLVLIVAAAVCFAHRNHLALCGDAVSDSLFIVAHSLELLASFAHLVHMILLGDFAYYYIKSWFEGGIRVAAFISGGLIPSPLRGTVNNGMIHIADWYATFAGLAPLALEQPASAYDSVVAMLQSWLVGGSAVMLIMGAALIAAVANPLQKRRDQVKAEMGNTVKKTAQV